MITLLTRNSVWHGFESAREQLFLISTLSIKFREPLYSKNWISFQIADCTYCTLINLFFISIDDNRLSIIIFITNLKLGFKSGAWRVPLWKNTCGKGILILVSVLFDHISLSRIQESWVHLEFYNFKNFVYRILSLFKNFVSYMYIVYQGFYRIFIVYQF